MTKQLVQNTATEAAPATPTELAVIAIWSEILQRAPIAPADNFLALGGDSLMMMMVLFRVSDELGVQLPPGVLLESPSLSDFCRLIDKTRGVRSADVAGQHGGDLQLEDGIV